MSLIFNIFYTFWLMGVYPLAGILAKNPKDWRPYASLVGMFGTAIVAILMDAGVMA